jgi:C4-dicarboxylate-specific signal transduction histidine kinase
MTSLSFKAAEFRLLDRKIKLISIQNIKMELEAEELEAWQKLIRVLTHEIVNSVTPVNSLTNTIIKMFEQDGKQLNTAELDESVIKNALEGLHSIEKRNRGLIGFVKSYRSLTRIPKPVYMAFSLDIMFRNIFALVKNELASQKIRLMMDKIPGNLLLHADEKLVEQVMINLINNAVLSLQYTKDPLIKISVHSSSHQLKIHVSDNGPGIPEDIIGNIFIPFLTTREEGSGIGLSLSRQIMRLHEGSISVKSSPSVETVFTLSFPL